MTRIRIAGIEKEGFANGPGQRLTVFVQGCPHHCPGCHNPETWNFDGGEEWLVTKLVDQIIDEFQDNPLLDGVTISGGEPFAQAKAVSRLITGLHIAGITDIWIYTGFHYETILAVAEEMPEGRYMLDVFKNAYRIVDGPFIEGLRDLSIPYRGSSNQRIINPTEVFTDLPEIHPSAGGLRAWDV